MTTRTATYAGFLLLALTVVSVAVLKERAAGVILGAALLAVIGAALLAADQPPEVEQ